MATCTLDNFLNAYDKLISSYNSGTPLAEATKYVLEGEGKKVRPYLALLTCKAFGEDENKAIESALALEMIHTYSLVHDDLPCMDDDDLRRGRPTAHVKFDEATAVLAGDSLLTDAFGVLASGSLPAEIVIEQIKVLAKAAGGKGMVHGQGLDMLFTGRTDISQDEATKTLEEIHLNKTGAMLGASLALGALSAGKDKEISNSFYHAGLQIGLAFQILDDLLDGEEGTGKSKGKDASSGKLTYLSYNSRQAAKDKAQSLTTAALETITSYTNNQELTTFITSLLERKK